VWGIMTSFEGIGQTGSTNLGVVAPGIAEALVATAAGLAAAIPAVWFYNLLTQRVKLFASDIAVKPTSCSASIATGLKLSGSSSTKKPKGFFSKRICSIPVILLR